MLESSTPLLQKNHTTQSTFGIRTIQLVLALFVGFLIGHQSTHGPADYSEGEVGIERNVGEQEVGVWGWQSMKNLYNHVMKAHDTDKAEEAKTEGSEMEAEILDGISNEKLTDPNVTFPRSYPLDKKVIPELAQDHLAMLSSGCINFMDCCSSDIMMETCGAHFWVAGVQVNEANELKDVFDIRPADSTEYPALEGMEVFDLKKSFCAAESSFNSPALVDAFFYVINKLTRLTEFAFEALLDLTGQVGRIAYNVIQRFTGLGTMGIVFAETLKHMEKGNVWKTMTTTRVSTVAKPGFKGYVKRGDPIHLYANMNMLSSDKINYNIQCRFATAFRYGFVRGLFLSYKDVPPQIFTFKDTILGDSYNRQSQQNIHKQGAGFNLLEGFGDEDEYEEEGEGVDTKKGGVDTNKGPVDDDAASKRLAKEAEMNQADGFKNMEEKVENMVKNAKSGMAAWFSTIFIFFKSMCRKLASLFGRASRPFRNQAIKFYSILTTLPQDPNVVDALTRMSETQARNLKNNPAPFMDDLIEAISNAIFNKPVYTMNKWCFKKAAKQKHSTKPSWYKSFKASFDWLKKKKDKSTLTKAAADAAAPVTKYIPDIGGIGGILHRRQLQKEEGVMLASEILEHISLDDPMSFEDAILLANSYHEEWEANGNRHPDPELEEELGVERPDLMWQAAHEYQQDHNELYPELEWRNPVIDRHAHDAHLYFQKYGDKHLDADPEYFYKHNPIFRRA